MNYLQQSFTIKFEYKVFFTSGLFNPANPLFNNFLEGISHGNHTRKILFVIDQGFMDAGNAIIAEIREYFKVYQTVQLVPEIIMIPGGELVKNDITYFDQILEAVNTCKIDRHSSDQNPADVMNRFQMDLYPQYAAYEVQHIS